MKQHGKQASAQIVQRRTHIHTHKLDILHWNTLYTVLPFLLLLYLFLFLTLIGFEEKINVWCKVIYYACVCAQAKICLSKWSRFVKHSSMKKTPLFNRIIIVLSQPSKLWNSIPQRHASEYFLISDIFWTQNNNNHEYLHQNWTTLTVRVSHYPIMEQ